MQHTAVSFQGRLNEVDGPGTILSASMDEDYLAHAQGFVMIGVARDTEGREVHVFQRSAKAVDSRPAVSPHDPELVDVRIEPTTIEGDVRRLRGAISECRGWNEGLRMFTFCGSMTRVLDELDALRASKAKN